LTIYAGKAALSDGQCTGFGEVQVPEKENACAAITGGTGSISRPFRRPNKRQRSSVYDFSSQLSDDESNPDSSPRDPPDSDAVDAEILQIEVRDSERLAKYMVDALSEIQQINCRTLGKVWIKMIEPKKQVKYPYNGNLKNESIHDPEHTKPSWWPEGVKHKEPDHLTKEGKDCGSFCVGSC
jgi:Protein of unknown function (DUF2841)